MKDVKIKVLYLFIHLIVLGNESRPSCMLNRCSTIELQTPCFFNFVIKFRIKLVAMLLLSFKKISFCFVFLFFASNWSRILVCLPHFGI